MRSHPVAVLVLLLDQVACDLGASVVPRRIPLEVTRLLVVVNDLQVPGWSRFAEGILGNDCLVANQGQRFALFVDSTDPELVLLHWGQALDVHSGVRRSTARDPKASVWIQLLDLVVLDGAATVILRSPPLESAASGVNVRSL